MICFQGIGRAALGAVLVLGVVGAGTQASVASCENHKSAEAIERGKAVWTEHKCAMCHSISGEGNAKNPLDGVGSRVAEADIRRWILSPMEMDPPTRKPDFSKIPADDLDALVAYLRSCTADADTP